MGVGGQILTRKNTDDARGNDAFVVIAVAFTPMIYESVCPNTAVRAERTMVTGVCPGGGGVSRGV